ncbi:hypothetical protein ACRAWF_21195 [Streptomyces sp. L7]
MVVSSSESTTYGDGPGQDPGGQWYRNLSIVGGPHQIAQPFTKWSNEAASVHTLPTMVTRAAELAWRAPAGPAYLNVPLEILLEEWDGREAKRIVAPGSTHSSPEEVDPVAQLIREASNPVIVTETAGREAGGFEALVAFAEAWNIPVVEPDSAVCGNFPRTHHAARRQRHRPVDGHGGPDPPGQLPRPLLPAVAPPLQGDRRSH